MQPHHLRIAVILAGGAGERFWPLSRRDRPKQLLRLTRLDQSMLEEAVDRIAPLIARERILIVTSRHLVEPIRAELCGAGGVPRQNVIGEPAKRNTAGALAWAAAAARAMFGGAGRPLSMAVLTADHDMPDHAAFRETVDAALTAAEARDALVTIGVPPTRAETGYGYIEIAEPQAAPEEGKAKPSDPFVVLKFREKPDAAAAAAYVESRRFFWNSGMFFWTLDAFVRELMEASPAHAESIGEIADAMAKRDDARAEGLFGALADISIDYALMEKAKSVLVVRAGFPWDDVGALDALGRNLPHDGAGNVSVGDPILIDAKDCIVYNEPGAAKMAVGVIGVEGLAVIVTKDGVLVARADRVQEVKKIVAELKRSGANQI